jgi:hypothetical protein
MNKIGIKFLENMSYEQFESFGYLFPFDFEYEDMEKHVEEEKVIELDIEEDEDRKEDLEVLNALLAGLDSALNYELYSFDKEWEQKELSELL